MKSLSLFLAVCSFSCNGSNQPFVAQKQALTPTIIRGEVDPDRGPEILKIFGTQLFPGFVDMAEGHSMQNAQQEKMGINQFAKGLMAFVSLIISEATRKPGMFKNHLLNEEFLAIALKKALESQEGQESLHAWRKNLSIK